MLKEKKDSEVFHINLDKEKITVRCRIYEMLSFSSHMQADSLLNYYSDVECNSILLMHGDSEKREEFVPILSQTRKNKGRKGKIYNAVSGHVFKV